MSDSVFNKDERIMDLVSKHYNVELCAANLYFHLATVSKALGYDNVAAFFVKMGSDKQSAHMSRLVKYMMKVDSILKINQISVPELVSFETIQEVLDAALKMESKVRESVKNVTEISLLAKDFETFERMQWFVKDSIEDLEEISDVWTYVHSPNVNLINIENIVGKKLKKSEYDDDHDED
ncbi:ferritin-like protein Rsg [Malacoplasma penetrans HF-2]|uniref:Ferritin-like protein Rsg n=1 Tax=Malacoplasma penetrans (strain HF-2) TaxID=272633 RepID=Q8EWB1_MALP2|nr:ferritin-like domain-containing protein [Malacoplasma penetrans]7DIE_A Chain A, Ferritin [Malacoplasma penetrans HF-2]7DIE_B Chain B, Ferritin [Malacoplasma penetrans HF-2]7DIE_C Chain C, Ferritin [Malacoplasma penetrans HF-2]7DIE_D Chain D, Ferritin [Malacoplasma penetrans HF-2]7DIE_E Chain E, Ferritin [Malacoplasma penetrans HF-2]7DIE_F Chain F, Ferritin [Malacoplasma penetrans HF-2]BAC44085.1 ferritin-like protein Rsg [Malacoplasma penetrans HF-2]